MAGNVYVVNTPWVFNMIWKIVKGWLSPATQAKVKILGPNFKEELLKVSAKRATREHSGGCRRRERRKKTRAELGKDMTPCNFCALIVGV